MSEASKCSSEDCGIHPVLVEKWKQIFNFIDIDNDGIHTLKDYNIMKDRLIEKANLTGEKLKEVNQMFHDMWVGTMGADENETLTFDQWFNNVKGSYEQKKLEAAVTLLRTRYFHCVDLDGDGRISLDEFKKFSVAVEKYDAKVVEQAFAAIDTDNDGFISFDEYIQAYLVYALDPNVKLKDLPLYGLPPNAQC